jgi:hypothetical protein
VPVWHPRNEAAPADPFGPRGDAALPGRAPAGSQRGLGRLRSVLDQLAAERRAYVRLATASPALAAAEAAVVAAFERVDVATLDVMGEIVGGVDPDRALADHAFAHRLHRRAGSFVVIDDGPLVVAPDLGSGVPSDAPTRSGRALALQLLAALLAVADGLPASSVAIGALPGWLTDEPDAVVRAAAEVAIRGALLPDHPVAFHEPMGDVAPDHGWPFVVSGVMPASTALVIRRPAPDDGSRFAQTSRAAARVGARLAATRATRLDGVAADHAARAIEAARITLERLTARGWRAVLGESPGQALEEAIGADAVAERSEPFDPFAAL